MGWTWCWLSHSAGLVRRDVRRRHEAAPIPDPDRRSDHAHLISTAFISLDGVVEDPGGQSDYRNGGWTFRSVDFVPEAYALKGTEQLESTAMLLGRRATRCSARSGRHGELQPLQEPAEYVVSTTLTDEDLVSDWGRPRSFVRWTTSPAQGVRRRPDHHPRQRHPQPRPGRRGPDRPLQPARLPASPRGRREAVRRHGQGHPEAQVRRQRGVQQRHPEEHPRRDPLTREADRPRAPIAPARPPAPKRVDCASAAALGSLRRWSTSAAARARHRRAEPGRQRRRGEVSRP